LGVAFEIHGDCGINTTTLLRVYPPHEKLISDAEDAVAKSEAMR